MSILVKKKTKFETMKEETFNNDNPELYVVPESDIKDLTCQIHPKENGLHKITIEFRVAANPELPAMLQKIINNISPNR